MSRDHMCLRVHVRMSSSKQNESRLVENVQAARGGERGLESGNESKKSCCSRIPLAIIFCPGSKKERNQTSSDAAGPMQEIASHIES